MYVFFASVLHINLLLTMTIQISQFSLFFHCFNFNIGKTSCRIFHLTYWFYFILPIFYLPLYSILFFIFFFLYLLSLPSSSFYVPLVFLPNIYSCFLSSSFSLISSFIRHPILNLPSFNWQFNIPCLVILSIYLSTRLLLCLPPVYSMYESSFL